MPWSAWFLIGYLVFALWVAVVLLVYDHEKLKGRPGRAALTSALVMWVVPAIFVSAMLLEGRVKR